MRRDRRRRPSWCFARPELRQFGIQAHRGDGGHPKRAVRQPASNAVSDRTDFGGQIDENVVGIYLKYQDFLCLDPRYRITDSRTSGAATNGASLTATSPITSCQIDNDRGQILFSLAPTKLAGEPRNWFRLSIIRQYLDDYDETNPVSPTEAATWVRHNLGRIDELFSDALAPRSCEALIALENANAVKYWGPPKA
jgi:hypothetical protein